MKEYIVQYGDTLPDVALKTLGDYGKWDEISKLNNLAGPVQLIVGEKLVLPEYAYTSVNPPPALNYSPKPPPPANMSIYRPAELAIARGFIFVVFEQLPEIGASGKIIRKVAVIPKDFSLSAANTVGTLSPAEHALNLSPTQSQYLSASGRPVGAPNFKGKPLLLDVAKIEAAGGKVITVPELLADLRRYAAENPSAKSQVERLTWAVEKIEGEVLVSGGVSSNAVEPLSSAHTPYVESAESLWEAFEAKKISKAELESGLLDLERAYSRAKVVGKVGRVLTVVGIVFTVIDLSLAGKRSIEQNSYKPFAKESVRQACGWGAALGGARVGAIVGASFGIETGPGAIATGAAGAVIGGAIGYFACEWIADQVVPN